MLDAAVKVGDSHSLEIVDDLTRTQIVQYAGASGDYNPLHSDNPFATGVAGYPGVFAHGMLTMGMTGRLVVDLAGPEGLLSYGVRFKAQVWPGDTLSATATVTEVADGIATLDVVTTNQRGEEVLAGTATVKIRSGRTPS
jgi:acyl dehydratase